MFGKITNFNLILVESSSITSTLPTKSASEKPTMTPSLTSTHHPKSTVTSSYQSTTSNQPTPTLPTKKSSDRSTGTSIQLKKTQLQTIFKIHLNFLLEI